jgi:hypothetical protein
VWEQVLWVLELELEQVWGLELEFELELEQVLWVLELELELEL